MSAKANALGFIGEEDRTSSYSSTLYGFQTEPNRGFESSTGATKWLAVEFRKACCTDCEKKVEGNQPCNRRYESNTYSDYSYTDYGDDYSDSEKEHKKKKKKHQRKHTGKVVKDLREALSQPSNTAYDRGDDEWAHGDDDGSRGYESKRRHDSADSFYDQSADEEDEQETRVAHFDARYSPVKERSFSPEYIREVSRPYSTLHRQDNNRRNESDTYSLTSDYHDDEDDQDAEEDEHVSMVRETPRSKHVREVKPVDTAPCSPREDLDDTEWSAPCSPSRSYSTASSSSTDIEEIERRANDLLKKTFKRSDSERKLSLHKMSMESESGLGW